jgi:hypothetical protein
MAAAETATRAAAESTNAPAACESTTAARKPTSAYKSAAAIAVTATITVATPVPTATTVPAAAPTAPIPESDVGIVVGVIVRVAIIGIRIIGVRIIPIGVCRRCVAVSGSNANSKADYRRLSGNRGDKQHGRHKREHQKAHFLEHLLTSFEVRLTSF